MREVAYEQWHRLLFARFLEVNGLLRHPEFRDTSLTLDDCADLADDLGEPDGWSVAARFAAEILPGVFRLDDPAVQVRFATEHRLDLEKILLSLPSEVFVTDDALGWVYQFWQTAEKKRVNESGVEDRRRRPVAGHPVVHRELHGPVPAGELTRRLVGRPPPGLAAGRRLGLPAPPR